jgi:hypothetical protein
LELVYIRDYADGRPAVAFLHDARESLRLSSAI